MAAFSVIGTIENVKYLPDSCILYVTEYKKGYKKSDGTIVDDKYFQWKVIYKGYFKKYISLHFGKGMLVEVKAEIYPYAIENGNVTEGFSVIGQTCNLFCYPRRAIKMEQKIIKESQSGVDDVPNLEDYQSADF